jgi:histidinol-phosphatase (PHP family)
MADQCARAAALGLDAVCFTEHLDFSEQSRGYYCPQAYFSELQRLREAYDGQLKLLAGLELSEPHQHQKELEWAQTQPYDFILGSVHYWIHGLFPSQMQELHMDVADCFARYWDEVLQMARCGGFDTVAHLDFPKRYFRVLKYDPAQIDEIFQAMIKNNLTLELNTSSLRRGMDETMPGDALLRQYIAQGGQYVTLGSDAHKATVLYRDVPTAQAYAQSLGLVPVWYEKRKRRTLAL